MIFFPAQAVYTVNIGIILREGVSHKEISVESFVNFVHFRPLGSLSALAYTATIRGE